MNQSFSLKVLCFCVFCLLVGLKSHSSTLAWKIPWTEEPGGLQSMGSRLSNFTFMHWRRKWQPTPVFLPGAFQGRGSLVGCRLWDCTESDTTEVTQQQQQGLKSSVIYLLLIKQKLFVISLQILNIAIINTHFKQDMQRAFIIRELRKGSPSLGYSYGPSCMPDFLPHS